MNREPSNSFEEFVAYLSAMGAKPLAKDELLTLWDAKKQLQRQCGREVFPIWIVRIGHDLKAAWL